MMVLNNRLQNQRSHHKNTHQHKRIVIIVQNVTIERELNQPGPHRRDECKRDSQDYRPGKYSPVWPGIFEKPFEEVDIYCFTFHCLVDGRWYKVKGIKYMV